MINTVIESSFENKIDYMLIDDAVMAALNSQDLPEEVDLTVVISNDDQLQKMNHEFRGIDAPTDVLSFPTDDINPDSGLRYLGDIIISFPRAQEQAEAGKHPVDAELRLLIVHGVLHLLGYDHADEAEKAEMWALQAEILARLGNPILGPAE